MRTILRKMSVAGVLVGCALLSRAQGAPSVPATGAAESADAFLASYIDGETVAVAHLDAGKIDTAALEKYVDGVMDEAKLPAEDDIRKQFTVGRAAADVFLARFKQLGGRHVYAVLAHSDIWPHMQPLAILMKIEPGGDAKAMKEWLTATFPMGRPAPGEPDAQALADGVPEVVVLRDDVLFIGQAAALARLRTIKPAARPELALGDSAAAFEAVGALTADGRRALKEMLPVLPAELGGGTTDFLTRAGLSVKLQVILPPYPSVMLAFSEVMAANPATTYTGEAHVNSGRLVLEPLTADISAFIIRLRDILLANPDFQAGLDDPDLKPIAGELRGLVKDVLTPQDGALRLDGAQIKLVAQLAIPLLKKERENAMRLNSAAYIREIAQAAAVYASDHKDLLPESLDVLVKEGAIAEKLLVDPSDPKHRRFIYSPIVPVDTTDATLPIIWQDADPGATEICVGFEDTHAEWISRKQLDAAIKHALDVQAKMDAEHKSNEGQNKRP